MIEPLEAYVYLGVWAFAVLALGFGIGWFLAEVILQVLRGFIDRAD